MTTDARHSKQTITNGGIHGMIAYEYANAAAREAATGFDQYDLYKVAIDDDTKALYALTDYSTPTWTYFGNASQELNKVQIACRKSTAGTLTKGTVVYANGYNHAGQYATVEAAKADSATTLPAVGFIEDPCTDSSSGTILIVGVLHDVDTSSWSSQDPLYVSESTAGEATDTPPSGPYVSQALGVILNSDASNGHIGVNVQGYRAIEYTTAPEALGTAAAGTANESSASDHVHGMPKLDDLNAPDDNTDLDATTSAHGLLPKLGGGTTNFLRADGSWASPSGTFGSEYGSGESLGESTTTGDLSYHEKLSVTTASLPAGDYLILWSCEWSISEAGRRVKTRVQIDDTTTISENINSTSEKYSDGGYVATAGHAIVTLTAAAHDIDIDFGNDEESARTAYIRRARIAYWRVS